MRRTQITEGFYWVDRRHFGLMIGKVEVTHDCDGRTYFVTFPGSSACYHIGQPSADNATRIEPKRFLALITPYVPKYRSKKKAHATK